VVPFLGAYVHESFLVIQELAPKGSQLVRFLASGGNDPWTH
jgi:hypothetical protein